MLFNRPLFIFYISQTAYGILQFPVLNHLDLPVIMSIVESRDEADMVRGKAQAGEHEGTIDSDLLRRRELEYLREAQRPSREPDVVNAPHLGVVAHAFLVHCELRLGAVIHHLEVSQAD